MEKEARVYVAGAATAVGAAIVYELGQRGFENILDPDGVRCDPADAESTDAFFNEEKPEYVFVAAGKTGGIEANRIRGSELMADNIRVASNVIPAAYRCGVEKMIYLASSCSYPRDCEQPMKETDLFAGNPEPTNDAYATAKRAGIKLCEAFNRQHSTHFVPVVPANPFGPGESFDPNDSHVIEGLIRRMHEGEMERAPHIKVWGTGTPTRDFIFIDDLADACIFVMDAYNDTEPINLGTGRGITIRELAFAVKLVTGYSGEIRFDESKPDGMPEKVLDTSKLLSLGWQPQTQFLDALEATYHWYYERFASAA